MVTLMDITSEKKIKRTDITNERNVQWTILYK